MTNLQVVGVFGFGEQATSIALAPFDCPARDIFAGLPGA